ncbi:MAG: hypothetical protein ACJ74J_04090 [Blastocatellia bacterium]
MASRLTKRIWPLMAVLLLSAALAFAGEAKAQQTVPLQKRRVVVQDRLTGTRDVFQIITWQTANPPNTTLPYAQAHLAIKKAGAQSPLLFQADGGETEYLINEVRIADLDSDGLPEIISLWQEGASACSRLRVFHWQRARQAFVELENRDEFTGIYSYRIVPVRGAQRILIYTRPQSRASRHPAAVELALRGAQLVRINGGDTVTTQTESGIEGQTFISPTHGGPTREGTPSVAPYSATLSIIATGSGREVAHLKTGSDGRFRVALPPGEYRIVPVPDSPGRFLPHANEQTVTVRPGQFAHIEIHFDSGMR